MEEIKYYSFSSFYTKHYYKVSDEVMFTEIIITKKSGNYTFTVYDLEKDVMSQRLKSAVEITETEYSNVFHELLDDLRRR